MKIRVAESDRLYFSNITIDDKDDLVVHLNNPQILHRRYIPWEFEKKILDEKGVLELINKWNESEKSESFGIFEKASNLLIGHVSYNFGWDTLNMGLDMAIYPDFWKKGYGTEVITLILDYMFNNTVVHNVNTYVDDWNEIGIKFVENFFQYCGQMRRTGIKNGQHYNTNIYDILRSEWWSK